MIGLLRDEKLRWKLAGEFGADAAAGVEKSVSRKSQGVNSLTPNTLPPSAWSFGH
jgi:hypothetical protein